MLGSAQRVGITGVNADGRPGATAIVSWDVPEVLLSPVPRSAVDAVATFLTPNVAASRLRNDEPQREAGYKRRADRRPRVVLRVNVHEEGENGERPRHKDRILSGKTRIVRANPRRRGWMMPGPALD